MGRTRRPRLSHAGPSRDRERLLHSYTIQAIDPGQAHVAGLTSSWQASQHATAGNVASKAQTELAGGIPFLSDKDLKAELDKAGVAPETADAIVTENASARIDGLRSSLSLLAIIALIALFASRRIPAHQPSASPDGESPP